MEKKNLILKNDELEIYDYPGLIKIIAALKEEVETAIKNIEDDSRYQSGLKSPASVIINAPLALMQTAMEAKMQILVPLKNKLSSFPLSLQTNSKRFCPECIYNGDCLIQKGAAEQILKRKDGTISAISEVEYETFYCNQFKAVQVKQSKR